MRPTRSFRSIRTTPDAGTTRTRVLAAANAATLTAAAALLLAVTTAGPAFADGDVRTTTAPTSPAGPADEADFTRTTGVSEASVVAELEPAVIGIHQGITGSFAHVPAPDAPDAQTPQTPPAPPAPAPPALPAVHYAPVK